MIFKTIGTNLLIQGMTVGASILTARILGPTGRGELALVLLYPQLVASVGLLGVDRAVAVLGGRAKIAKPFATLFTLALLLAMPTMLAGYVAIDRQIADPHIARLAELYLLCIPGIHFYTCTVFLFNGVGSFGRFNGMRLGFYVANIGLLAVIALSMPVPLLSWVIAANAAGVAVAVVLAFGLLRSFDTGQDMGGTGGSEFRTLRDIAGLAAKFAIPVALTSFNASAYQVVLEQCSDVTTLGIFVVLYSYSRLLSPVGNALGSHIFRRGIAGGDQDIGRMFRLSFIVYSVAALPLVLAAAWVVPAIFGRGFEVRIGTVACLIAAGVLALSADGMAEYLKGRGRVRSEAMAVIAQILVIAVMGWTLVPKLGMLGMAVALLVADLTRCVFLVRGAAEASSSRLTDFFRMRREDFLSLIRQTMRLAGRKKAAQ